MENKCYCGHTTRCDCGPETLEEVTDRLYPRQKPDSYYGNVELLEQEAFEQGAKWQQEQIGKSEFLQKLRGTLSDAEARRLIFEQFKK